MKIIYLTISYNKTKNIYTDLIEALIERGHKLTVVTARHDIKRTYITDEKNNLKVLNVKTGNQFEKNLIKKGLNMIFLEKFFLFGIKKLLKNESYDLVLYATPPISFNNVVRYCKKKFGCKSFLMLKDIFPQNAVDLEMFSKKSLIYYYFRNKEKKLYSISNYIGCMSVANIQYLKQNNQYLNSKKIHLFFNSMKIEKTDNSNINQCYNSNYTTFLFGGNMGKPQNIKGLLRIADALKNYSKARFLFIGKGSEETLITKYINDSKNPNVEFINYLPREEYNAKVLDVDIGIISLDPRFTIPNIPSKILSYMYSKKAILAITDTATDINKIIEDANCGWWCNAEKTDSIVDTIKYICDNKSEIFSKGINGYNYLCKNFDVFINVSQIENFMEDNS